MGFPSCIGSGRCWRQHNRLGGVGLGSFGSPASQHNDVLWLAHLLHDHHEPFRYDLQAKTADKNAHLRRAGTLMALMETANADLAGLIGLLYSQSERYGSSYGLSAIRRELEGFDAVLTKHADVALSCLPKLQAHSRITFIEDLGRLGIADAAAVPGVSMVAGLLPVEDHGQGCPRVRLRYRHQQTR